MHDRHLWAVVVTASACLACESTQPIGSADVLRTDSAGIDVVQVQSFGDSIHGVGAAEVRIGSEGEQSTFTTVSDVLVLASGNLVIIDNRGARIADQMRTVPWIVCSAGLLIDDRDRIWVAEHDPAARSSDYAGTLWSVYDSDTNDVTRVRFPGNFDVRVIRAGRVYGVTTLESAVQVVDIFTVDMGPGSAGADRI